MYCVRVSTRHCDPQLLYSVWGHYERILTSYSTLHNHPYLYTVSYSVRSTVAGPLVESGFPGIYLLLRTLAPHRQTAWVVHAWVARSAGEGPK